jgi:hypothetical protein
VGKWIAVVLTASAGGGMKGGTFRAKIVCVEEDEKLCVEGV